jgi:hypothetical protein
MDNRWNEWSQDVPEEAMSWAEAAWNAQQDYIKKLERIIQHAGAERTGLYFICGEGGTKDSFNLPDRIYVCPSYGLEGFASYKKDKEYSAPRMVKMISYSTNFMGPISLNWYKDRDLLLPAVTRWSSFLKKEVTTKDIKQQYKGGRIDIRGTDSIFGEEISLPIMQGTDWDNFSYWLRSYKTKTMKTLDQILVAYYQDGYDEIRWWKE